jgi:ribosomal protein L14
MLIVGSRLKIVDNTGAKISQCIKILNQSSKAKAGDLVIVSLKEVRPRYVHKGQKKEQIKKGEIRIVKVLQTKSVIYRRDGTILKLFNNFGILVARKNKVNKALGSRYIKALPKEIKSEDWVNVLNMSPLLF